MATKYTQPVLGTTDPILSTELNALADQATSALSPEIDNEAVAAGFLNDMLDIVIGSQAVARKAGASISVIVVPSVNGTDFADTAGECINNYKQGPFWLDAATNGRRISPRIVLPPTKFKLAIRNNTGQPFPATGNSVSRRGFTYEDR